MTLRCIVIDDEELARAHLCKMLDDAGVEVVAQGENGLEAISLTESFHPDLVFLDIQMPDMTGMQAAVALENFDDPPHIVFVSGYSEYAIEAFERQAFDYLIKPVAPERLARTLERVRKAATPRAGNQGESAAPNPNLTALQRLPVRTDYSIKLLRLDEIECAFSRDRKVYVKVGSVEHRTYYTLSQLETLLPASDFIRIHASAMVRLARIDAVNFLGNHTYSVTLQGGSVLPVGRAYYAGLQARLGL